MGSSITISWLLISPFWNIPPTSCAQESEDGNNLFSCTTAWQTSYLYCKRSLLNYVEHNSESFNSQRNVSDFQKTSLLSHSPSTLLISSTAGWRTAPRGRKGSENVLIKIFFPIFHTHWREIKEEFPTQFISSPEIKHVFANNFSWYKRKALCVCQSGSAAQWLNWQIILTQSCSRALPVCFPSHPSPWQLASYLRWFPYSKSQPVLDWSVIQLCINSFSLQESSLSAEQTARGLRQAKIPTGSKAKGVFWRSKCI